MLAMLLLTVVLLFCTSVPRAHALESLFTVEPVEGPSGADEGYFDLRPGPGSVTKLAVTVRSTADEEVTVHLKAVTGETGAVGDIGYATLEKPVEEMARWVTLDRGTVALAPGEQKDVTLTFKVPRDARPGDHVCGLAAWIPAPEPTPTATAGENEATITVKVQQRRIIPIMARVPGAAESHLTVTGVEPSVTAKGVQLQIGIVNDGRLFAKGDGVIKVTGPGGASLNKTFPLGTTVPDTAMAYPIDWTAAAENGTYTASVSVEYDDGAKVAEWHGTFAVGDQEQAQIEDRVATPETAGASNLGWYIIAGLGAMILLLGGILLGRRRAV